MSKKLKILTVSGGKGGVGKTFVSINLAISLSKLGFKVLLFDGDFGLANIGVCLNINTKKNIVQVLNGQLNIRDIWVDGPGGVKIFPSVAGHEKLINLERNQYFGLLNELESLSEEFDYLVIDTAAGLPEEIFRFLDLYQDIFLVASNEPASIADCYALIKHLSLKFNLKRIHLISNMGKDEKESFLIYNKISKITDMFLDVHLGFAGYILFDENVRNSAMGRVALMEKYPHSKAANCLMKIANKIKS